MDSPPGKMAIALASPEECVFFHELAHAGHDKLAPLKPGQDWKQEIVAELSAAVLCRLVGKKPDNLGQSYRYIEKYAIRADQERPASLFRGLRGC